MNNPDAPSKLQYRALLFGLFSYTALILLNTFFIIKDFVFEVTGYEEMIWLISRIVLLLFAISIFWYITRPRSFTLLSVTTFVSVWMLYNFGFLSASSILKYGPLTIALFAIVVVIWGVLKLESNEDR